MNFPIPDPTQPICVAALYRFARLDSLEQLRASLQQLCRKHGIKGTLLIATEGVNGTIAGPQDGIGSVLGHIRTWPDCGDLDVKVATEVEARLERAMEYIRSLLAADQK